MPAEASDPRRPATPLILLAALLAGASGLGLELLAIDLAGLALGYGRAGPTCLALFIAGWALGARWAGRRTGGGRRTLVGLGLWLGVVGAALPHLLSSAGSLPGWAAWGLSVVALLVLALPQGAFLPLFARQLGGGGRWGLGPLFGANLVGAALGAWLLGQRLPEGSGRAAAGLAGGACALTAAALAAAVVRGELRDAQPAEAPRSGRLTPRSAGLILASVTAWALTLEWFGVRLGVLWLGGMQDALGAVLVASLVALALGAALLPRWLPRTANGLALLALSSGAGGLSFFFLPQLLGGLEGEPLALRALVLVGPALLPLGAWVPVLHRELAGESGRRLGELLAWEAAGALVGLPVVHFLLLPQVGLGGVLLGGLGVVALALAALRPRALLSAAGLLAALAIASWLRGSSPVLAAPPLANPAFRVLASTEDEHFAVTVVDDGLLGERTLLTDGFRAAARGHDYAYMRALGHLPLLMHPAPREVGVLAFGTGTTAGAVSLHGRVESIEVLELSRAVIEQAPLFEEANHGVLRDPRVRLSLGDGRQTLAGRPAAYDVLTMEPLLPDSPFGVYLYTEGFYRRARAALKEGGLLCQWVPPHALEPATFEAVVGAFTEAFPWSSVWVFGTQVILLGGERPPQPTAAAFPAPESELGRALAVLGLESLSGVLARYALDGEAWPQPPRPLTDLDPWVVYRPRRRGSVLLADLPLNLATVRARGAEPPLEWSVGLSAEDAERRRAVALLREAREVRAAADARSRIGQEGAAEGGWLDGPGAARLQETIDRRCSGRELGVLLAEAAELAPGEAGLLRYEARLEFEDGLREGLATLLGDRSEAAAGQAATALMRAVALRPERADARAYLAVALERLGSDRAEQERRRARELCPRLGETRVGVWLERLGAAP